ncbi:MAG: hypothetical protein U1F61_16235 [Opitutaceae bacterium]
MIRYLETSPRCRRLLGLAFLVGLTGCQSAAPTARTDYIDPQFGSAGSLQAARADEIRRRYSSLTDKQVAEKASLDSSPGPVVTQRDVERKAAQRAFEDALASSRRP